MAEVNAILLLNCPDKKGIIAKVSNFIFKHGGNIIRADQHASLTGRLFSFPPLQAGNLIIRLSTGESRSSAQQAIM
jgi:formyltetrahydrofolate hydrolase